MSCIEPSDIYPTGFCLVRQNHGEGCVSAAMCVSEDQNFDIFLEPDDELCFRHFSLNVRRSVILNVLGFSPAARYAAACPTLPSHAHYQMRHRESIQHEAKEGRDSSAGRYNPEGGQEREGLGGEAFAGGGDEGRDGVPLGK